MRILPCFLLIIVITSLADDDFQVSGSSTVFAQFASDESQWSEMPDQFWRWRFNPVFSIYGIPVVANVFYSSEESLQRQNMNRIYISSSPSASTRENSALSFISNIGIGASNPSFTTFTMNAPTISGVNIALNPGIFYLAAAGGRNRRSVEPEDDDPGVYERNLYAVQTGLGSPYGSHTHLCVLYGRDKEDSIADDSTYRITPAENWVASLDWAAVLFQGKFKVSGEVAGSMYTRDVRSPDVDSENVPQWLIDFSGANVSSGFGWALDAGSTLRIGENQVSLLFRRVDPGFRSMGAPYLLSDEMSMEGRLDRYFMDRQLMFGIWYGWSTDNLMDTKLSTTEKTSYGARTGIFFPDLPRLFISYSPSHIDTGDSTGTEIETSMLSISSSYGMEVADLDLNTSLAVCVHDNSMGGGSSDYSSTSVVFRESVAPDYPVVVSGCLGVRRTRRGSDQEWNYTGDLRGTWYPSTGLSLTLGGHYDTGEYDRKRTVLLNGGFPVCSFLTANVSGEYMDYSSEVEDDYDRLKGGVGMTVVW